jgi:hypothetical protein
MFGTNKLCMKGITFQHSNVALFYGRTKATQNLHSYLQLDNLWREKLVSLLMSLYIYIIYKFYTDFSLFRQTKRQNSAVSYNISMLFMS